MIISILPFNIQNPTNFKGAKLNKQAAKEIETIVTPFLEEFKLPQNAVLLEQLSTKLKKLEISNNKILPEYKTNEFESVKRLKLAKLNANRNEFEYLEKKSENWYAGIDAQIMAQKIRKSGLFDVPDFLNGAFVLYKKLRMDIQNGLANMTYKKLAPVQYEKEQKIYNAKNNLSMSSYWYNDVNSYVKIIQKQLDNNSLTENIYINLMQKISDAMKTHKKLLPEIKKATETADTINKEISITQEDENIIKNLHKPALRVISRNVSKFNQKVQNINLSDEQENFLNALFKKQQNAIEKLWNTIEKNKKATFTPKSQNLQTNFPIDDDMPF